MELPEFSTLLVDRREGGVVVCTFNRPDVRNALSRSMVNDIRRLLEALSLDDELTALVLTGAGGRSFISGADIGELKTRVRNDAFRRINTSLFRELEQFAAPTIAAVVGYALGGGCELAMACDLRVAGKGARFGQPEVGLGIVPGAGGCQRLPRLVGIGRARELIFTGRIIDAAESLAIGLVNRVVDDADVVSAACDLAAEIGRNSRLAVRMAKTLINSAGEMSAEVAMALEATTQAVLFEDDEKQARMQAFLDRRTKKT
ncbi:MAG: enoyl-CoA hydratase [Myxococcota bacterium]